MESIKTTRSRVMTIANRLVKRGFGRRLAMLKAWIIVKAERLGVRVAGVTTADTVAVGKRQDILAAVDGRPAVVKVKRESDNLFDPNAVSVWVFAEGTRGYYKIGYLPKNVAALIAPIMDKGAEIKADQFHVTGALREGFTLGAHFAIGL